MQVRDFEKLPPDVVQRLDVWDNDACRGYMILAARDAGIDADTVSRILEQMPGVFDEVSTDEAAKIYRGKGATICKP